MLKHHPSPDWIHPFESLILSVFRILIAGTLAGILPEATASLEEQQAVRDTISGPAVESDLGHFVTDPDKLIASCDEFSLHASEFYTRLNYEMIFAEVQDPEQLDKMGFVNAIIRETMLDKARRKEAVQNGAHEDPGFTAYMKYHRMQFFHQQGIKTLLPTLPPAVPIDSSPPDEDELRDHFGNWQREFVRDEPIWVHYIKLQKKKGDSNGNKEQRIRAEQALADIKAGENFVDIKTKLMEGKEQPSSDPWLFERFNSKLKPLRPILEPMQAGEVSNVIEQPEGYYIFHVLPGQEWTDLSSFERVKSDPGLTRKLADYILARRPRTDPARTFIDDHLILEDGYEEFDLGSLKDHQVPTPETVLTRLDDAYWTMRDLTALTQFIGATRNALTKHDVGHWIHTFRSHMLINTLIDRDAIKIEGKWRLVWKILETNDYVNWLREELGRNLLEQSTDLPKEGRLTEEESEVLAQEIRNRLTEDIAQRMEIHMKADELDLDRVEFYIKPTDRLAKPDSRPPVPN